MRKIIFFILFILFSSPVWATNYCTAGFSAQGCWVFAEGSGTTVADSSGNGNTGTFTSATWENNNLPARSYIANAANFTTAGSLINCGTSNGLFPVNGTAWSFVGWFYTGASGATAFRFLDRTNGGTGALEIISVNDIQFTVSGSSSLVVGVSTPYSSNTWTHLAVTWDGSTNASNVHIYLNGTDVTGSRASGSSLTSNSGATFYIGNRAAGDRTWSGNLTEYGVFNQVLTGAQITDIYNNGLLQSTPASIVTTINLGSTGKINGATIY